MNLSHIINEFSFGPYFPDITQPLDYSYEIANDRMPPHCLPLQLDILTLIPSFRRVSIFPPRSPNDLHRAAFGTSEHTSIQCDALYAHT